MNYLMIIFLLIFSFVSHIKSENMRLYSFYTPSHEVLKNNWFLPSIQDNFEIDIRFFQQECEEATFKENGWNTTMLHKVEMIIDSIQKNWNKIFIYADIDIQFFKPIEKLIERYMEYNDLVVQRNNPS